MPTIGVALAIPEPWASELQAYRLSVGDTTATMIPTHITLIPPVEVDEDDLAEVEKHLTEVASATSAFRIHLRGTGTFRPVSPVVFVTVVEGISACEQLAVALRRGPLSVELQFPYHPHVTIAHHLADEALDLAFEELAGFESLFDAEEFHLYVHDEEKGWQPSREFPLVPVEA
jgi:2'-5' RNA ligase